MTASCQMLTFTVSNQLFGISVLQVNDVLGPQKITAMPLSPPAVAGAMNLRGRIVTAIDVRRCLNQQVHDSSCGLMSVVVDQDGELFSLIIDSVGDVLSLSEETYEAAPPTLDTTWRVVSQGIHKLDGKIMVILDVKKLLQMAAGKKEMTA